MRPSGVIAVASAITRPNPPAARPPRWTRCQSSGTPSAVLTRFWHIGESHIRLGMVMPRNPIGARREKLPAGTTSSSRPGVLQADHVGLKSTHVDQDERYAAARGREHGSAAIADDQRVQQE